MGKDKLRKFAENLTFRCMVQPEFDEIFHKDYKLKGRWGADFFGNDNPIVLELGCGKGEYTVELARRYPHKNFIGIDIKGARMWRGAKTATELELHNVAFLRTRIEFIESFFAEREVSEVWLTFSDPRLKGSQAHRRLTSPEFLTRYASFLTPDGVVHLKTDSAHLYHYTKHVIAENGLKIIEQNEDIYSLGDSMPELLRIQTTYEKVFVAEGLPITYLAFLLGGRREFTAGEFSGDAAEHNLDEQRVRQVKNVEIDDRSGFCFGVVRAIDAAESFLRECGSGYSLGEIVHNRMETSRLEKHGLKIISHDQLSQLPTGATVLIRAHGEPPSTFHTIEKHHLSLVDATCPVVASLQRKVKDAWQEMQRVEGKVLILGKQGHSEVVGLSGQVGGDVLVVESVEDLQGVDFSRPITLLSQTTQSVELFETVKSAILEKTEDVSKVTILDTICREVSGRNEHLFHFAKRFDVVLFVSGRHSSNGKALYEICLSSNAKTFFIENQDDITPEILNSGTSFGICGATSTPLWLMQKIAKKIAPHVPNIKN